MGLMGERRRGGSRIQQLLQVPPSVPLWAADKKLDLFLPEILFPGRLQRPMSLVLPSLSGALITMRLPIPGTPV